MELLIKDFVDTVIKPALANASEGHQHSDGLDLESLIKAFQAPPTHQQPVFREMHLGKTCPIDVREMETYVMVCADLPGVDKKSINISVLPHDVLHIQVERRLYAESSDTFMSKERFEGVIERKVQLPKGLDKTAISASYEDGVLKIKFPKLASSEQSVLRVAVF